MFRLWSLDWTQSEAPAVQAAPLQLTPASWPRLKAWLGCLAVPLSTEPQPCSALQCLCVCLYVWVMHGPETVVWTSSRANLFTPVAARQLKKPEPGLKQIYWRQNSFHFPSVSFALSFIHEASYKRCSLAAPTYGPIHHKAFSDYWATCVLYPLSSQWQPIRQWGCVILDVSTFYCTLPSFVFTSSWSFIAVHLVCFVISKQKSFHSSLSSTASFQWTNLVMCPLGCPAAYRWCPIVSTTTDMLKLYTFYVATWVSLG